MADHKIQIVVIVNGTPALVEANPEHELRSVIEPALKQTGNEGQPPDQWELRDQAGTVLDVHKKIESFHFPPNVKLFLNLKAGVGGEAEVRAQFVDPNVSRAKFERELAEYRAEEDAHRRRGWFLLKAEFPIVLVALAAPQLKPPAIVTGVRLDYTNYDAMPPSLRLVDPFTDEPYVAKDLPTPIPRMRMQEAPFPVPGIPVGAMPQMQIVENLMQAYSEDDIPFFCHPGVREYHEHPAHSGDAWELHRKRGDGKIVRLIDIIYRYAVLSVKQYNVALMPQVSLGIQPAQ